MSDPVTYTCVLALERDTVESVAALLHQHRRDLGTRPGRRALGCFDQAVLFCRWMLDRPRMARLAIDAGIAVRTAYRYIDEALDVVAAQSPSLGGALLAAAAAGYPYMIIDGTLIATDRCSAPGPTKGVDAWWSGKHHHHGGNIQVITAPDGWPLWVSPVRPGREHDTTCARTHPGLLPALDAFSVGGRFVLADLGYEGEKRRLVCPYKVTKTTVVDRRRRSGKKTVAKPLTQAQACINRLHAGIRCRVEQGNARLKMTFAALQHVSRSPWRITAIAAAALVLLHTEHHRTT